MKSPDEIKKGLEYCSKVKGKCKGCPCYSDSECSIHLAADALAYIQQLEEREWNLFDLLSSAWHGKQYYFKQEDGSVYSRESCQYLTFDQAIDEFAHSLAVVPGNNEFQYETGFIKGFEAAYPKWISVKERLPERAMKCLVRSKAGRTFTTWYDPEVYRFAPHFAKSNVTHWMHLPCAPKEEA